jgi:hypothetical protein
VLSFTVLRRTFILLGSLGPLAKNRHLKRRQRRRRLQLPENSNEVGNALRVQTHGAQQELDLR